MTVEIERKDDIATAEKLRFTPDLIPSDITGTDIIQENAEGRRSLVFAPGVSGDGRGVLPHAGTQGKEAAGC